jgi:hypothetical protein
LFRNEAAWDAVRIQRVNAAVESLAHVGHIDDTFAYSMVGGGEDAAKAYRCAIRYVATFPMRASPLGKLFCATLSFGR